MLLPVKTEQQVADQGRQQLDADGIRAPAGTLSPGMIDGLHRVRCESREPDVEFFVDGEAAAVGRLHKRATVIEEIERLRKAGLANINVDLIAGLPHQTAASWDVSLNEAIASAAPHVSDRDMLEVDEDSRLGRKLIAGGTKYHAHHVPDDDLTADFYATACDPLQAAGSLSMRFRTSPGLAPSRATT